MKKLILTAAVSAVFLAAGCKTTSAAKGGSAADGGKITSIEQLSVKPGEKVVADRFLGGVYSKNLIADKAAGNFPVTNLIVFEPGARSAWHMHGGSSGTTFAHAAANMDSSKRGVEWFDMISEEEYKAVETEVGIAK